MLEQKEVNIMCDEIEIQVDALSDALKEKLENRNMMIEDIVIKDDIIPVGYIITPDAYKFFLKQIEISDDKIAHDAGIEFDKNREQELKGAVSFEDYLKESKNV